MREALPKHIAKHDVLTLLHEHSWDPAAAVDAFWADEEKYGMRGMQRYTWQGPRAPLPQVSLLCGVVSGAQSADADADADAANSVNTDASSATVEAAGTSIDDPQKEATCGSPWCHQSFHKNKSDITMLSLACGHIHCSTCFRSSITTAGNDDCAPYCYTCSKVGSTHLLWWLHETPV